jgi:hypothetical protein
MNASRRAKSCPPIDSRQRDARWSGLRFNPTLLYVLPKALNGGLGFSALKHAPKLQHNLDQPAVITYLEALLQREQTRS